MRAGGTGGTAGRLVILVEPVGGTGGTTQEDFAPAPGQPTPVPPVPPEKRSSAQRGRNCKSRRRLLRPGGGRVIENFGDKHVEAVRHRFATANHFLLALQPVRVARLIARRRRVGRRGNRSRSKSTYSSTMPLSDRTAASLFAGHLVGATLLEGCNGPFGAVIFAQRTGIGHVLIGKICFRHINA